MGGEGALVKDFVMPHEGEWGPDIAEQIDAFFDEIVNRHVTIKTGRYTGTGRELTVSVRDLPRPPKFLAIQPSSGGTVYTTLLAYPSGNVTAWNNKGFTLSTAAAVNTQNTDYSFLILA